MRRRGRERGCRRGGTGLLAGQFGATAAIALAAIGVVCVAGSVDAPVLRAAVASVTRASTVIRSRGARAVAARHVVVVVPPSLTANWTTVAWVRGHQAAWIAQRSAATLMRFDQSRIQLILHAGSSDGGVSGWIYGDQITRGEIHLVVAGFNGGFKLSYGGGATVGFMANGRVAVPLKAGLASIVTYADGTSNIAAWRNGVPRAGKRVFSVLQNQRLLVDRGVAAATLTNCVVHCWGVTIQNLTTVARSGLGITAAGQLVWAAGEQLSPTDLAGALVGAGAVRAIELDINPHWVAGYLYVHHPTGPVPAPVVPGQPGILGQLLAPDSRDFLTVVAK